MVRCTLQDSSQREIPRPSSGRGQWVHMERVIEELAPTYIEALGPNKECLASRALDVEEVEDAPAVVPENPLAALMQILPMLTQLIVDAGDASAMRHQAAYELAFQKQNELVKMLADRLGGIERAWHQMILERANEAQGNDDGAAMSLIGNIMGSQNKTNGKPNGNGSAPKAPEVKEDD